MGLKWHAMVAGSAALAVIARAAVAAPESRAVRFEVAGTYAVSRLGAGGGPPVVVRCDRGTEWPLPKSWRGASLAIRVSDVDTGRSALVTLRAEPVRIDSAALNRVEAARVRIRSAGLVPAGVLVEADGRGFHQAITVARADEGVGILRDVPMGVPLRIQVSLGAASVSVAATVPRGDYPGGYSFAPIEIAALSPPAYAESAVAVHAEQHPSMWRIGNWASLIVLVVCLGLLAYAFQTGWIEAFLRRIGVREPAAATGPGPFAQHVDSAAPQLAPLQEAGVPPFGAVPNTGHGPRLACIAGPHAGEVFQIGQAGCEIGRDAAATLCLSNDQRVSRRHAAIIATAEGFEVTDLQSANGTFVAGARMEPGESRVLAPGTEIILGDTRLRYET